MTKVRDFVYNLAKTGRTTKEILVDVEKAFGEKAMGRSQVYQILSEVKAGGNGDDRRRFNPKRTTRTPEVIEAVQSRIEADQRITLNELQEEFELCHGTISAIMHKDIGFEKKSARWVPRLLSDEQKAARVKCSEAFLRKIRTELEVLRQIITMDESTVAFHTPETKQQSKQWLLRGTPGPLKARVHASRRKQMVMAFFDFRGMIYQLYVPENTKVNGEYVRDILRKFLRNLNLRRPELSEVEWFLPWDNAPVHTAKVVQEFLTKKNIKTIDHPPYSPDLAPADYFLFPRVKSELSGQTIGDRTVKTDCERVVGGIPPEDFRRAFDKWIERNQK